MPWRETARITAVLALIQGVRVASGAVYQAAAAPNLLGWDILQVCLFTALSTGVVLAASRRGESLSFWPELRSRREKILYAGACLFLLFMVVSSLVMNQFDPQFTVAQLSSVVVVPLFEELLFRGCVWNRLQSKTSNSWVVLGVSLLLFGLWHLGYADTVAFRMARNGAQGSLATIMFWKVFIGMGYGLVTGFIRLKTKNCAASFLLHAVLNLFGR